jgi:RNA recognition motif-containing protein
MEQKEDSIQGSEEGSGGEGEAHFRREKRFGATPRPPVPNEKVTNRVYVGNLPWSVSWQDLKDHFRQVGEPVHASVFLDDGGRSKGCGIVEFNTREEALNAISQLNDSRIGNSDRPIFVREDREDRNAPGGAAGRGERREYAPREEGGRGGRGGYRGSPRRDFGGAPHSPEARGGGGGGAGAGAAAAGPAASGPTRGRQIFVGNLPYHTSWQELKDLVRPAGNIIRADVLFLPNGRPKGQGTVLFENNHDATRAIEMFNGYDFQGRKLAVHEDKFAS